MQGLNIECSHVHNWGPRGVDALTVSGKLRKLEVREVEGTQSRARRGRVPRRERTR